MKEILNKIEKHNTIIIHRHKNPDLDAYGSQLGLAYSLRETYPNKKIFVVGEENQFSWMGAMDQISDEVYKDSLVIIVDVAVSALVSDDRYNLANEIAIIDHHQNPTDLKAYSLINPKYGAAAELVAEFIYECNLKLTPNAATMLFGGIISDTGRFQYTVNNPNPLIISAKLLQDGADASFIYENLYQETLENKKAKSFFANNFKLTKNNVAYLKNDLDVYEKFDLSPFGISRGMVGVMAGIQEVPIWCNFTIDPQTKKIMCEFRSKKIHIVDIARKYGGGGHNLACGATVDNFDVCDLILEDFDKLVLENK